MPLVFPFGIKLLSGNNNKKIMLKVYIYVYTEVILLQILYKEN